MNTHPYRATSKPASKPVPALVCKNCMHEKHVGGCAQCGCCSDGHTPRSMTVACCGLTARIAFRFARELAAPHFHGPAWQLNAVCLLVALVAFCAMYQVARWSVRKELEEARAAQRETDAEVERWEASIRAEGTKR